MGYLPIGDHGVIGDLHTVALVGTDGSIDWYCPLRFDAPSVFAAILDYRRGGCFRLAPAASGYKTKQLYFPDTNVLVTRFLCEEGVGEVQDFMPVEPAGPLLGRQRIVRRVLGVRGEMRFRLLFAPRFDYARAGHELALHERGAIARSRDLTLALSGGEPLSCSGGDATCEFDLPAGSTRTFVLEAGRELAAPSPVGEEEAEELFEATVRFWRGWLAQSRYSGRWREMVNRSALTLKLLTYRPTGAFVAAPTTSLPERIGGSRNWDYRYTWIRDAAFSLHALLRLGFVEEAQAFNGWLRSVCRDSRGRGREESPLQVLYGVDGRSRLPEETLGHLEGYRGSAPVRVGNAAAGQLQLDIYGELLDSVYLFEQHGRRGFGPFVPYDSWTELAEIVDWVSEHWDQADEGIWEVRGGRRRFTYSRLMCWVALDRAIRIAEPRALPADVDGWRRARDTIFLRVMERCWNEERQAFAQSEDSAVLDASVLLMPLVHFIAPTDPRWLATLDAIAAELVSDSLVYRYNPDAAPDGLPGSEGTFSMCSFWYVECLARAGRLEEAQLAFEKMHTYANHLGLYSEQIGSTGELLGNFPQAFTHLALISAAVNLDRQLG
ncbi:MAG: glycoside hydrolase family 15 protein [Thermoleophilia bacterium]|nr:glycoside hydrolase family 15 protein [Thermoleophilia bacterium]